MNTVPTDPTRSNPVPSPVHVEAPHDPADADYDSLGLADAVACLDALEEPGGRLGSRLLAAHLGLHALAAKGIATKLAALVGSPTG